MNTINKLILAVFNARDYVNHQAQASAEYVKRYEDQIRFINETAEQVESLFQPVIAKLSDNGFLSETGALTAKGWNSTISTDVDQLTNPIELGIRWLRLTTLLIERDLLTNSIKHLSQANVKPFQNAVLNAAGITTQSEPEPIVNSEEVLQNQVVGAVEEVIESATEETVEVVEKPKRTRKKKESV